MVTRRKENLITQSYLSNYQDINYHGRIKYTNQKYVTSRAKMVNF